MNRVAGDLLSFGPYVLDTRERRLTRDGSDLRIASRHLDLSLPARIPSRPGDLEGKVDRKRGARAEALDDERAESTSAAPAIERTLEERQPGNAGWLLPVEPLVNVIAQPERWTAVLARLRIRAA